MKTNRYCKKHGFLLTNSLRLNDYLKNLAANLAQNRSIHSINYACRDVCATFFARFPRKPFSS